MPDQEHPDALVRRADHLLAEGRVDEAAQIYTWLLAHHRPVPLVLNRLSTIAAGKRDYAAAARMAARSLDIDRDQPLVLRHLVWVLYKSNALQKALHASERAIKAAPRDADLHNLRGLCLWRLGRSGDAVTSYEAALRLNPDHPGALMNRGAALIEVGRYDDALAAFDAAIAANPRFATALANRGVLLADLRRYSAARESLDAALSVDPSSALALSVKAELLLLEGDYPAGWQMYEARWRSVRRLADRSMAPRWRGEDGAGKTLLVAGEVGLGDFLMFARYADLLQARGARVVLHPHPALESLLTASFPACMVSTEGLQLPPVDVECPVMSLPAAFGTTLRTVPSAFPYLHASPQKILEWQTRLGNARRPRIGICWSATSARNIDRAPIRARSMTLRMMEPLLALPFEFHSLQKEHAPRDEEMLRASPVHTHESELHDMHDTAALVTQMDLVLSIDTSVAHLAGGLGRPLWVLLPYSSDYRWQLSNGTPVWYPHAQLMRQDTPGDWGSVVAKAATALGKCRP